MLAKHNKIEEIEILRISCSKSSWYEYDKEDFLATEVINYFVSII